MSSSWEKVTLGDICSFRRGVSYDGHTLKESPDDGIPYINMKSFTKDGGYSPRGLKFFSGPYTDEDLLTADDLVISNTDVTLGGDIIGAPALPPADLLEGPAVCSHHVTRLRPTGKISNVFLCHLLKHPRYRAVMRQHARGTTVQMLDPAAIKTIEAFIPSDVREQSKVAQIFDTLDTQIRETKALIAKLERIKQGLLTDLLTRGIDQNGKLRPTFALAPHLYKKSPLGPIPREWSVQRLVELGDSGLMNGVFKEPSRVGSGVPLVNVADLYRSESVDPDSCERFAATQTEIDKFGARQGDIFFTRSSLKLAGIAQTSYMAIDPGIAVFECHVMRLRPNQEQVVPRFLKEWCVGRFARQHFMANAKQVTMTTISQDGVASLLCPIPSLEEQWKAAERIDGIDAQINSERVALRKLMRQKLGLMDDLLTGRVRVTPLLENKVQATA